MYFFGEWGEVVLYTRKNPPCNSLESHLGVLGWKNPLTPSDDEINMKAEKTDILGQIPNSTKFDALCPLDTTRYPNNRRFLSL